MRSIFPRLSVATNEFIHRPAEDVEVWGVNSEHAVSHCAAVVGNGVVLCGNQNEMDWGQ